MSTNTTERIEVAWLLSGKLCDSSPMRSVRLDHTPFCVGRRNGLGLTLPSPAVSGEHAEFSVEEYTLRVRDLGSTNGTYVNGIRIDDTCELNAGDLVQFADIVFRVSSRSPLEDSRTVCDDVCDRAMALIQFDKLITERAVLPFLQPIITLADSEPVGFEVLGRSRLYGMTDPKAMFQAAALLDMESELSRILRAEGIRAGESLPPNCALFVNTHPSELDDIDVLAMSLRELREEHPTRPMVLEIHEAAVTSPAMMRQLKTELSELHIELAYDDFGAGQTRLAELIEVPPDYLKFDLKLIRNIDQASPERKSLLKSLVDMARSIGVTPLAEGVETRHADQACREIGFKLGQGFLYGRPGAASRYVKTLIEQEDD